MGELREVLLELWDDRRRLLLVVVALAWGTLGLTVLLGFGDGFDDAMHAVLRRSGERMLRVHGGSTTVPWEGSPAGRYVPVTFADADALRRLGPVRRVSIEHSLRARVTVDGSAGPNARVHGVEAVYADIRGLAVRAGGRFLSPTDLAERRRVAVLGDRIARDLLGGADPVGRTVRIAGQPFVVVGALARQIAVMNYDGPDDEKIFVPESTLRALFGLREPEYVLVEAASPQDSTALADRVRRTLASRSRFDPEDRGAVGIRDHAAQARQISAIVVGTQVFLSIVGVLGLLVAAIGVANVMHALVEERVREIGLRLALGARPGQIRARQLLETLALVGVGGGAGFALAAGLLWAMNALPLDANVRAYLGSPVPSPAVAASVALLLGACALVAGWHPARRAASIEPVEALRHE